MRPKSVTVGYEGIELDLPVHALYIYRDTEQLLDNVFPLINDGIARSEKVIYVGDECICKVLRKNFKNKITTMSKVSSPRNLARWLGSQHRKLPKKSEGLKIFLECGPAHLDYETGLDDFIRQPDIRIFLLCMYKVGNISSNDLTEILKTHPYVFVEHLIRPNCFYSRMKQQNWLDGLTNVFNRRYFDNQLATELQRASRYEHSLSVILLDVDGLKSVNEEFGNQIGDLVLQQLSRILERSLRSVDILARYGGDEFAIMLPETKKAYTNNTAARIIRNVRNHDFFKDNLRVKEITVSMGIVGFPEDAGGANELMKKAEAALCQAKRRPRARIYDFE
jgi:diguanylate cyclase (GGDEF)-like protein